MDFHKLVELGYKEIKVSFLSLADRFDFTRRLVDTSRSVLHDVWIQGVALII